MIVVKLFLYELREPMDLKDIKKLLLSPMLGDNYLAWNSYFFYFA